MWNCPKTPLRAGHTGRINRGSWRKCNQLSEITSVEWKFGNQFLVDYFAQHVARGVLAIVIDPTITPSMAPTTTILSSITQP